MQSAWKRTGSRYWEMDGGSAGHRPWATRLVTLLLIAVPLFGIAAGGAAWQSLAEAAGLRASTWAWGDPAGYLRLLSYQLIHGSASHFFWNTMAMLLTGYVVERRNGTMATVIVLVTGGLVAALAHLSLFPNETRLLVGASGAVSALFGMAFVSAGDLAVPVRIPRRTRVYFRLSLRLVIGLWVSLQVVALLHTLFVVGGPATVAYWSHIAGFASGMVTIVLLRSYTSIGGPAGPAPLHASLSAGD